MSERRPSRPEQRPSDLGRFAWHPEPELLGYTDPAESRADLEALGAAAWSAALDYLYGEAMRRPTAPEQYAELRRGLFGEAGQPSRAPAQPTASAELLAEFQRRLAPYQYNASHPRSFAYFTPPSLPIAIVGELLAQWTNQSVDISHASPSASIIEEEVVAWLLEATGYGPESFGVLTSGGAMANFMALVVARDVGLAAQLGLADPPRGTGLEGVRAYASDQAHFSIARALDVLGFPAGTLRVLPADERFRLTGGALNAAVAEDRAAGLHPWLVAAVAGSTNTGSVDRIGELADIAATEGLWLHVDAAYGGAARLSAREAWRVPDLERADTITLDPHKWFFQPYDLGGLLVKRREDLLRTFHRQPEYYPVARPEDEPLHWYQYSLEGTRRFRGLKLWLSWKSLGTEGFARLIEANIELAAYLARRVRESHDFEALPTHPELSVVCFRHVPADRPDPEALDRHQVWLQRALEVSGDGWLSTTRLRGATWLRAGIVNYLATEADVDRLLATLRRLAADPEALSGG